MDIEKEAQVQRDLVLQDDKVILHIDMDAFYAQVEQVRLGYDRSVPVVVQQWGAIIAVSYAARDLGVSRGSRAEDVAKIAPSVVFVHAEVIGNGVASSASGGPPDVSKGTPVRFSAAQCKISLERYRLASAKVFSVLNRIVGRGGRLERASVDEAFIDVSDLVKSDAAWQQQPESFSSLELFADDTHVLTDEKENNDHILNPSLRSIGDIRLLRAARIAKSLRADVLRECGYTSSCGISHAKTLAKLASAQNKPDKQTLVSRASVDFLLQKTPMRKIRMLGGKLGDEIAQTLQVTTLSDVKKLSYSALLKGVSNDQKIAEWLFRLSRGCDDTEVVERKEKKSMLANKSFPAVSNISEIYKWNQLLSMELVQRMYNEYNESKRMPKTLSLHFRTGAVLNYYEPGKSKSCPIPASLRDRLPRNALQYSSSAAPISSSSPDALVPFFQQDVEIMWKCANQLVNAVGKGLLPCTTLGLQASQFEVVNVTPAGHSIKDMFSKIPVASASASASSSSAPASEDAKPILKGKQQKQMNSFFSIKEEEQADEMDAEAEAEAEGLWDDGFGLDADDEDEIVLAEQEAAEVKQEKVASRSVSPISIPVAAVEVKQKQSASNSSTVPPKPKQESLAAPSSSSDIDKDFECPICAKRFSSLEISVHVNACLEGGDQTLMQSSTKRKASAPIDNHQSQRKAKGLHSFFGKPSSKS